MMPLIPISCSCFVVSVAFAALSDVPSAPRILVDVFSFAVHAEFEVGVLAPEAFRWQIFLGEDLERLNVLICHLHGKLFVIHLWRPGGVAHGPRDQFCPITSLKMAD